MRKLSSTFVPPFGGDRSFIKCVTVDFGPSELLGPFFIEADAAARRAGVFLTIGDFSELVAINRANRDIGYRHSFHYSIHSNGPLPEERGILPDWQKRGRRGGGDPRGAAL